MDGGGARAAALGPIAEASGDAGAELQCTMLPRVPPRRQARCGAAECTQVVRMSQPPSETLHEFMMRAEQDGRLAVDESERGQILHGVCNRAASGACAFEEFRHGLKARLHGDVTCGHVGELVAFLDGHKEVR